MLVQWPVVSRCVANPVVHSPTTHQLLQFCVAFSPRKGVEGAKNGIGSPELRGVVDKPTTGSSYRPGATGYEKGQRQTHHCQLASSTSSPTSLG